MKALIVFYSAYGHIYKMANAVLEGGYAGTRGQRRTAPGTGNTS